MREKLEAAWNEAHNNEKAPWEALVHAPGIDRFIRLLDAEAWLDAAMMLVPEGREWTLQSHGGPGPMAFVAHCVRFQLGDTPAEALLAAIEKARTV